MSNIFRYTPLTYFQVPEAVIELGVWAKLTEAAKDLYMLLLAEAQRTSRATLSLTAADATKVGLVPNSVKAGREGLCKHKLIKAKRTRSGYSYELLNPASVAGTAMRSACFRTRRAVST